MRERELFPHGSLRASANRSRPLSASGVRLRPVPAVSPALVAFGDGPLGPRLRLFAQPLSVHIEQFSEPGRFVGPEDQLLEDADALRAVVAADAAQRLDVLV